jgi:hypothetical protein
LTLAPSSEAAGYVHQYFNEGYLFVHDQVILRLVTLVRYAGAGVNFPDLGHFMVLADSKTENLDFRRNCSNLIDN